MEIKEALLPRELNNITNFLEKNNLLFDKLITKSFYIDVNDQVVGTVSIYNNIIKCFAVDKDYRDENYGGLLISYVINYFYQNGINHYMVYTKVEYAKIFTSLNFHEITRADKTILLEGGSPLIKEFISSLKRKIEYRFSIDLNTSNDVASVVVNCNPVTNGHISLIEEIAKEHKYVIVFILEEDLSLFTYKERMSLLTISLVHLANVVVVPSSEYIISSATFPNYFLKDENLKNDEWSKIDALIYRDYFMAGLNIEYRYVGTEDSGYMKRYNDTLKEVLGDKLVIVNRFTYDEEIISASSVRALIIEHKYDEALKFIPNGAKTLFYSIAKTK